MSVLKVKIAGQRYRYEVMQVVFEKDNEWLKDPKELIQGKRRDFLRFNDNRLDICDYEQFNYVDVGVAICYSKSEIFYELCNAKGTVWRPNGQELYVANAKGVCGSTPPANPRKQETG